MCCFCGATHIMSVIKESENWERKRNLKEFNKLEWKWVFPCIDCVHFILYAMRFQSKIIGLQTEYQVKWNLFLFLCSFIDLNFRIASKVFRFIFDKVSVKWCAQNQFKTILRRCFNSKRKTGFFVVAVECKSNECEIVNECVCKSCRVSKYLCFVTRTKESHHSRFSQFSQLCIQNTHSPIPGSYNWAHIAY